MKAVTSSKVSIRKLTTHQNKHSRRRQARMVATVVSATAFAWQTHSAHATTYTWDPGLTPATPSGGTGTWDVNTTAEWSNGTSDVVWTDTAGATDTAIFGATSGTVTLNTNLGAAAVIFQSSGYAIAGTGILRLDSNATVDIDTTAVGNGTVTLGSVDNAVGSETWNVGSATLNFSGNVRDAGVSKPTWTVIGTGTTNLVGGLIISNSNSSRTITFAGNENIVISGLITNGGTNVTNGFFYDGTGTLTLSNAGNTFNTNTQGVAVQSGTLIITDPGALGNVANPLVLGTTTSSLVAGNTFEATGTSTMTLANPVTLNGAATGTATIGGTTPLVFTGTATGGTSNNQISITDTGGVTFGGTVFLSNNTTSGRTLILSGSAPVVVSAQVSDALGSTGSNPGSVSCIGSSTLSLTNTTNNFTGTLTVGGNGTLALAPGAASTPSTFVFGNNTGTATLLPAGGNLTIGQPVTLNSTTANPDVVAGTNNVTFNGAVSGAQSFPQLNNNSTGTVTLAGAVYCSNNLTNGRTLQFGGSGNTVISGIISDANGAGVAGSVTYNGTGTLTLTNANLYNGVTTVSSGTLSAANPSGSATSTGNVTLNGGTLASGSAGAISGNVLAGSGPHTIAPGGLGAIGTLNIGGLTSSSLTTLNFDLGTGAGTITNGDNLILGSGTVSIASGTQLSFGGTPIGGNDYQLIGDTSGTGAVVSTIPLGNFVLPSAPAGLSYSLALLGNFIDLDVVASGPVNLTWNNAGATGLWNTTDSNWNNGSTNTTYSNGAAVVFNDNNNGNYAVTLNTTVSPGSVSVNNSTVAYTIGGTGSIAGTAALTKSGSNIVSLNTVNTYTGGTNVSAGTLVAGVAGSLPDGAVNITGGSLRLGLSIGGPTISSLAISGNGTFDIGNNHVFINYGAGPDPIASIQALLNAGFNGGAWNGPGGITSGVMINSPGYGIGYADSADAGNPAGLASGTIEIAYTLLGDVNLDHTVNGVDFGILAANFNKGITGWDKGDFNYDNSVNGVDFGDLAANFNKGAANAGDIAALDAFAAANGLLADVPEPATLGLLAVGTVGLLSRRRRKTIA